MAALTRVLQKIFGSTPPGADQFGKIGSLAAGTPEYTTDPLVMQSLSNYEEGLYGILLGNNSPATQDFNSLFYLITRQLAYMFERGISEWSATTNYFIGSFVSVDGRIFRSLTDDNLNNDPETDVTNWFAVTELTPLPIKKPNVRSSTTNGNHIIIPGSATAPSTVMIAGQIYKNTTDLTLSTAVSGVGGLDTGSMAIDTVYYVYGVLEASPTPGGTYRGTFSVTPPSTGPTGFSTNWTYIGSFKTSTPAGAVVPFTYTDGLYINNPISNIAFNISSSTIAATAVVISELATSAYFYSQWLTVNAVADDLSVSPDSSTIPSAVHRANSGTVANVSIGYWELPILIPATIYAKTTSNSDDIAILAYGWKENPEAFK